MLKSTLQILLLASLCVSTGCSDDDKGQTPDNGNDGGGDSNIGKPLPNDCFPTLNVQLQWGDDPKAFRYQIDVGYQAGGAAETYILDTPKESFQIEMDRGAHYYYGLTRLDNNGHHTHKTADILIPSCDDREEFKTAHPEYNEPPILKIQW